MPTFRIKINGFRQDPQHVYGGMKTIAEHKERIKLMQEIGKKNKIVVAFSANKVRAKWQPFDGIRRVPRWEVEAYKHLSLHYLQTHERVSKHWEVRVYEYPEAVLALLGKKVVQYNHHHVLVDA